MKKLVALIFLITAGFYVTAGEINRKDYGEKWPFTVEKGDLVCRGNAVFLLVNGTGYAVNGVASALGYADIEPIWSLETEFLEYQKGIAKEEKKSLKEIQTIMGVLRIDISPILNDGLKLCGD
jgi:hypothetical protein